MDLDELKRRLQSHLTDGLMIVIGSGLSVAEGIPGMAALATHLCSAVTDDLAPNDLALWRKTVPLIRKCGLEAALKQNAPTAALQTAIATTTADFFAEHERRVISEVFNGGRTLRLTRLLAHVVKPSSGLPIVTTNYERLVEVAVEKAGLGVDTMFVGRFAGELNARESRYGLCRGVDVKKTTARRIYRSFVSVYKPHGSLDWYLHDNKPVCCGMHIDGATRLIITPGQNKFRDGYDSPFDVHRAKANEAIDRAARFLILGYGFNDDHLETHLVPAIGTGKPTVILTKELSTKACELAMAHANVIAMDLASRDGQSGTRVYCGCTQEFVPHLALWDVHSFIDEVLQP